MSSIRVGIIGGAGYTGGELIRILLHHPEAEIVFIYSESNGGKAISDVDADLLGETDLIFTSTFDDASIDVLFLCSGHGQSKAFFEAHAIRDGLKVIDLSQDFRIKDAGHFRTFVYGLPESNREAIKKAENNEKFCHKERPFLLQVK